MDKERYEFMTLRRVPGRLTMLEASWHLGFSLTDMTILVGVGLVNAIRFFARPDLDELANDAKWLDRACAALGRHWRVRNERLTGKKPDDSRKSRLVKSPTTKARGV
jgi:hypothetical protein